MGKNTLIEWCDHSENIWIGCVEVHDGCTNCYARIFANRFKKAKWGIDVPRVSVKKFFSELTSLNEKAKKKGVKETVFVGSLMDIFERDMPIVDNKGNKISVEAGDVSTGALRNIFLLGIGAGWWDSLIFLLLTKRPSNILKYIPTQWRKNCPDNVMFGTSISRQDHVRLIKQLMSAPGKKFLSVEPMLERIDITNAGINNGYSVATKHDAAGNEIEFTEPGDDFIGVDWVLCGGESGQRKRYFNPDWARDLRNQCKNTGVPFFMKQIDKIAEIPDDLMIREYPDFFGK